MTRTALADQMKRIERAKNIEALSDIARDVEAMAHAEHWPQADRDAFAEAVKAKTIAFGAMLAAG